MADGKLQADVDSKSFGNADISAAEESRIGEVVEDNTLLGMIYIFRNS